VGPAELQEAVSSESVYLINTAPGLLCRERVPSSRDIKY
jgi:hypothetical protein